MIDGLFECRVHVRNTDLEDTSGTRQRLGRSQQSSFHSLPVLHRFFRRNLHEGVPDLNVDVFSCSARRWRAVQNFCSERSRIEADCLRSISNDKMWNDDSWCRDRTLNGHSESLLCCELSYLGYLPK